MLILREPKLKILFFKKKLKKIHKNENICLTHKIPRRTTLQHYKKKNQKSYCLVNEKTKEQKISLNIDLVDPQLCHVKIKFI